ncbi:MAG: hypothetical protein D3903_14995 [Candidatus Electrothrix sp. GM3_4]|nr:hypothetical protein [Candidatus Electrothrix sp. GM3_4]
MFCLNQGDSCQIYEVAFFINDYSKRAVLWQATWRRIWRHLEQAEIQMATPQREIFLLPDAAQKLSSPLSIMNNCAAFSGISDKEKTRLTERVKFCRYPAGEVILHQEATNDNLFVIIEGVVSFSSDDRQGKQDKKLGVAETLALMTRRFLPGPTQS